MSSPDSTRDYGENEISLTPMPMEECTPAQHSYIIKLVCNRLNEPWTQPPMDKVRAFLNDGFDLNLDMELEPLTKKDAHRIITQLIPEK